MPTLADLFFRDSWWFKQYKINKCYNFVSVCVCVYCIEGFTIHRVRMINYRTMKWVLFIFFFNNQFHSLASNSVQQCFADS